MLVPEDAARFAERLRAMVETPAPHRALIRGIDAGLDRSTPFLALEYAPGDSLDVLLRQSGAWPAVRALPVLRELAAAIDAAWAAGSGHGALHPRDIYVAFSPADVRVTGFGIGQALESVGAKAPVRRPYSAPERGAEPLDIRADVYSLGVVAFEMLSGQRPVGPDDEASALAADLPADARAAVRRVIAVAMSESPNDRYENATAFLAALEGVAIDSSKEVLMPPVPEVHLVNEDAFLDEAEIAEVAEEKPEGTDRPQPAPEIAAAPVVAARPEPRPEPEPEPATPDLKVRGSVHVPSAPVPDVVIPPRPPASAPVPAKFDLPLPPRTRSEPSSSVDHLHETSPFPWAAVSAVFVAGLVLAGVVMYQWGWSRGHNAGVRDSGQGLYATSTPSPTVAAPPPVAATSPTPAVAATPPPVGRLVIQSTPTGAIVTIDGHRKGETPLTVEVPLGKHDVQVARSGYVPKTQRIELSKKSAAQTVRVTLQRGPGEATGFDKTVAPTGPPAAGNRSSGSASTGSADVDSNPRGARVSVDGKFVGISPLRVSDLSPGEHRVQFDLAGHKSVTSTVNIVGGDVKRVTVTLVSGGVVIEGSARR